MTTPVPPAPLRIDVEGPLADISPDLWGIFIEDINSALDGGLNAELVRNGDFEFSEADHAGWGALTAWQVEGAGSVDVRVEAPIHPANRHYVRATGPVALVNEGWDGILLAPEGVRVSLAVWGVLGATGLRAAIVDPDGVEIAGADLAVPAGGWSRIGVDLVPHPDAVPVRGVLRLTVPDGAVVELDLVSARPRGADGSPLVFRADLLAALRELAPSFVRFPGGCVAHGLGLDNLYHWKSTVGPLESRAQIPNLWGYHQSRQIGYYEYFLLCEALGATALPVVAAGVCCQNIRGRAQAIPDAEMAAYVQDVLDLVEFADGGVETPWGAVRAELGHPEPFGLRYLGVGNEDEITDDFRARYALIEDALREAHPEVEVVGTAGPWPDGEDFESGWSFARERGTPIVDEHAYRAPQWFHQSTHRYDDYPRSGPAVYFGEYAARSNRVRSALAEAAFMIGMERNGDIVRLASYAPLLARIGETQWVPDLLYFDADRVLRTANHAVQRMFGVERGTRALAVEVAGTETVPASRPVDGTVRVVSPGSGFTLTDVRVGGARASAHTTGPDGAPVAIGELGPDGGTIEFEATRTSGVDGLSVWIGADDPGVRLEVILGSWDRRSTEIAIVGEGLSSQISVPVHWDELSEGRFSVRIERDGAAVRLWVDGRLHHDAAVDETPEERVVVGAVARDTRDGETVVVRVVNATDTPRDAVIHGVGAAGATATVLAGAGPDEGAAFEASPVTAVETVLEPTTDGGLSLALPAWSFAVAVIDRA